MFTDKTAEAQFQWSDADIAPFVIESHTSNPPPNPAITSTEDSIW